MPTYESSISINAPQSEVWQVLADVIRWPEWLPTVEKVEPLDGGQLAKGSRFAVRQPKLQPVTWKVTEVRAQSRFVWEAKSFGTVMVAQHDVNPRSLSTTTIKLQFSFNGIMGPLVGTLAGPITAKYLAREAAALKQRCEAACS